MRVILIDIPTVKTPIPKEYAAIFKQRLIYESIILKKRLGCQFPSLRQYSRGLLSLATFLKKSGADVYFYNYENIDWNVFNKQVDVVLFSLMTVAVNLAASIAEKIKTISPKIKIVVCGPHVQGLPHQILDEFSCFDYALVGDFENCIYDFLNNLSRYDVRDVVYSFNPLLDRNELLDFSLLPYSIDKYSHNIQTTEGCSCSCKFCATASRPVRLRSLKSIDEELQLIYNNTNGQARIHLADPYLNVRNDFVEMCDVLAKYADKFTYSSDLRLIGLSTNYIKSLYHANVRYLRFGLENVTKEYSKYGGENSNILQDFTSRIKDVSDSFIVYGYWLTGFPNTTQETIEMNAHAINELIEKNLVDIISNKIMVPYPGTPFYDEAKRYGIKLLQMAWSCYDRFSYPVYDLDNFSSKQIYEGFIYQENILLEAYKRSIKSFYVEDDVSIINDYKFQAYFKNE